jgi:hypothetical protein
MRALFLLFLGGCTVEMTLLESRSTSSDAAVDAAPDARVEVMTCEQAWSAPDGATCRLPEVCLRSSPEDPICCRLVAVCDGGRLVHGHRCDAGCQPCASDRECPHGVAVCELERCVPCRPVETCEPCPAGFAPLMRNGCPTCDCAPRSECERPDGCGLEQVCYVGAACAKGCVGDFTCCANVCGPIEPPCPRPAPLGCQMRCPAELGCDQCAGVNCMCMSGRWFCRPVCSTVVAPCFVP